ncbi:PREDICTED: MTSS1-like protein isoform X8 [Dinoponera quadriceps]|uniref:MTSS1-like protein isoform X8 n=1 Tax=Dinoponera quadriceps TaxID=609295 RepID=A0A6P3XZG9_DINQU|nr:PREDICTED: MTSS1-like protein isoform X8 [Dinoponera quadriceps]
MDATIERECSALGGLFQQIVTDMKNGAPLWEDLISKATKLHTCLRAAILAISAYLEAFQKIADAATNARGATKEIGTALTRICLRHKAVETRMKSFTSAIMDCLVLPLQEKLEDWKKSLINLDKEHAKEFKKARAELKKRSTDTLRLQKKKARKGQVHLHVQGQSQSHGTCPGDVELNRMLESSAAVVQEKRLSLEETERKAVRAALLEERGRFCLLARFLKPVLETSVQYDRQNPGAVNERPHTISSAYEKGHQRPALSVYTFQAPDRDGSSCCHSQPASPVSSSSSCSSSNQQLSRVQLRRNNGSTRPPIPSRCSSLERPTIPMKSDAPGSPRGKPKLPLPAHLAKELATHQLQQPMYVNMHELANLAASRAQEMQLPLPPPPTSLTAPGTDKVLRKQKYAENPERDAGSQTSESSLESSSGYGSQNTLPHSHSLHNQNENTWNVPGAAATLMARRGSMQQVTRPPPPTRRTSTVITAPPSSLNEDRNENACEEAENLPPPPAFLLEGSSPTASPTPQRSISVSETVRTLTELRHTPASPSLLRKATGQQQQQQQQQQPPHNNPIQHNAVLQISRTSVERSAVRSISQERGATAAVGSMAASGQAGAQSSQGPGGVGQGFMAVLNAKLIGTAASNSATAGASSGSPKSLRKQSLVETQQSNQKNSKSAASGFLETLNAKLAQQQQALQGGNGGASRSASVRRIMGNRVPIVDPLQVRDSLMDQIRRGTSLRKTSGPINDRSAPKIY